MARPLRIEFPNAVYHITSRGNARQAIFVGVHYVTISRTVKKVEKKYEKQYCLKGKRRIIVPFHAGKALHPKIVKQVVKAIETAE